MNMVAYLGGVRYDRESMNRRSIRLPHWDYRTSGAYFVTICTFERTCLFDDRRTYDAVRTAWRRSVCAGRDPAPHDLVIMPNHVHGIVWIPVTGVGARHPRDRTTAGDGRFLDRQREPMIWSASPLRRGRRVTSARCAGGFVRSDCRRVQIRIGETDKGAPGFVGTRLATQLLRAHRA
jgi:hypothetical protein